MIKSCNSGASARLLVILEQLRDLHARQLNLVTEAIIEVKAAVERGADAPSAAIIRLAAAGGVPTASPPMRTRRQA